MMINRIFGGTDEEQLQFPGTWSIATVRVSKKRGSKGGVE